MIDACRTRLPDPARAQHPGLALGRYLKARDDQSKTERHLLGAIAGMSANDAYRDAFQRWQAVQQGRQPAPVVFTGTLAAPLAVGLGNVSPTQVGLTTHHTYGMPVIPGSALKGLCRRAAAPLAAQAPADFQTLFGDTKAASHFVFWDAWYVPDSVEGRPFSPDTITVHHADYYQQKGGVWPTDFDDPNPVPFLTVRPGAQFLFVLDAPTPEWGQFALGLLTWGLANLGAGGKTNAGYGYFALTQGSGSGGGVTAGADTTAVENITSIIGSIRGAQDTSRITGIFDQISHLSTQAARRQCLQTLQAHLQTKGLWTDKNNTRPWYKELERLLQEAA